MKNLELSLYILIGRCLPKLPRASGVMNRIFKPIYNRKKRDLVTVDVMGKLMELDASEDVDGNLLFCPQLYDFKEMAFMYSILKSGDCFIDVGAHIGLYSLMASKYIDKGKIVSIEADPNTFVRLEKNIRLNEINNVIGVNKGVSDKFETLSLSLNLGGNKGGQSFLGNSGQGVVDVECFALLDILKEINVGSIKLMKLDLEGFEYKVLSQFFIDADKELYPKYIITEYFGESAEKTTGNQIELLERFGYRQVVKCRDNRILKLVS
jgi:FkbM family methyltransferase